MLRTKINEEIIQISGIETNPFRRYVGKTNIDTLINDLEQEKIKANKNGYTNLEVLIKEDDGIIDIYLYGDRDLTEDEKEIDERIAPIFRIMDKTSMGLTRNDLFKTK